MKNYKTVFILIISTLMTSNNIFATHHMNHEKTDEHQKHHHEQILPFTLSEHTLSHMGSRESLYGTLAIFLANTYFAHHKLKKPFYVILIAGLATTIEANIHMVCCQANAPKALAAALSTALMSTWGAYSMHDRNSAIKSAMGAAIGASVGIAGHLCCIKD